jgi:hypothetical protein
MENNKKNVSKIEITNEVAKPEQVKVEQKKTEPMKTEPMTTGVPGDQAYNPKTQGVPVNIVGGNLPTTAMYTGTKTAPVTASPGEILTADRACKMVMFQAVAGNTQSVMWGGSATTCTTELIAGAWSPTVVVANANLIFVKSAGNATQTVNWVALN